MRRELRRPMRLPAAMSGNRSVQHPLVSDSVLRDVELRSDGVARLERTFATRENTLRDIGAIVPRGCSSQRASNCTEIAGQARHAVPNKCIVVPAPVEALDLWQRTRFRLEAVMNTRS